MHYTDEQCKTEDVAGRVCEHLRSRCEALILKVQQASERQALLQKASEEELSQLIEAGQLSLSASAALQPVRDALDRNRMRRIESLAEHCWQEVERFWEEVFPADDDFRSSLAKRAGVPEEGPRTSESSPGVADKAAHGGNPA